MTVAGRTDLDGKPVLFKLTGGRLAGDIHIQRLAGAGSCPTRAERHSCRESNRCLLGRTDCLVEILTVVLVRQDGSEIHIRAGADIIVCYQELEGCRVGRLDQLLGGCQVLAGQIYGRRIGTDTGNHCIDIGCSTVTDIPQGILGADPVVIAGRGCIDESPVRYGSPDIVYRYTRNSRQVGAVNTVGAGQRSVGCTPHDDIGCCRIKRTAVAVAARVPDQIDLAADAAGRRGCRCRPDRFFNVNVQCLAGGVIE